MSGTGMWGSALVQPLGGAMQCINTLCALQLVRGTIENAAADLFEVNAGKVSVEQVTEAIKGVIGHYSATLGTDIRLTSAWAPERAVVDYGRHFHVIRLEGAEGQQHLIRQKFRSRRTVRVWAKRRYKWDSYVFSDIEYRDSRPLEYITLNFTVSRTDQ